MATKNFKGFQLVALTTFDGSGFTKDKDTLYFVRTSGEKDSGTDGFLYFNGKKYGTGADVITKYGELNGKTISAYVADEIAKVNTAAGELGKKVDANTKAITAINGKIDTINGEANVDGSIKKAVADAKAAVVGTDEDASTADTIKGAKTGVKEAKDAAAAAQIAADAKVKSVEGTDTVVATTTEHAVKVSLKTNNDGGNVKFTQDEKGLSANVTIPDATVKGVTNGDKVISLGTDGKLSSTISLSVDATAGTDGKKYIHLNGIGGADLGKIDIADFVKDGMLDSASLATDPEGQPAGTYIVLTWNTDSGKKDPMYINVTSLIDVYTATKNGGLVLEDHAFSVDTNMIATAKSVAEVASRTSVLEGKVGSETSGLIKDVADNKAAIATLNGDEATEGSVNKKIKDALDAGAVTLKIDNNDPYLGVTATTGNNGTVYTLASKADEIKKTIKAEADKVKVSVEAADGAYVTGSVDTAGRVVTLSEKVQAVADADATIEGKKGLAEASDVKAYVDGKVSDKNVTAEGESGETALVGASAKDNKVTVTTTKKLKDAVALAETSVQSVNGKTSSAVTLTGADIATDQNVGGSATATVNAVLADIYTKLGVVVKADGKTIKEADDHTLSVNLEATAAAQAAGHVALEHGEDGALYGVMYYSGDDAE